MYRKGLTRLYDRLTVWERIPLLIAAEARGDGAEYQRLFGASALRTWRFPEHLIAEEALHVLTLIYVGEQLDAAANYFFARWQTEGTDTSRPGDWLLTTATCSYFFAANAEAWRRFCSSLGIDPDALTAANHGGQFLRYCEENLPASAPTADALRALFRESDRDLSHVATADDLLESWRTVLREMTHRAPQGPEEET